MLHEKAVLIHSFAILINAQLNLLIQRPMPASPGMGQYFELFLQHAFLFREDFMQMRTKILLV